MILQSEKTFDFQSPITEANAVVLEDVPTGALAVGVPARTLSRRRTTEGVDEAKPSKDALI